MQIWLDTINCEAVAHGAERGLISGVTTNPSILSKTKNVPETLLCLLELQKGPIAVQVTSDDVDTMIEEGKKIFEFSSRTIIKVPVNNKGLIVMRRLREEKIPVLGTAIFDPTQALLAANLGASYLSPYFSHMHENGHAHESLKTMISIVQTYPQTKILAASIKTLDDLLFCALLEVEAVTIKDDLYYQLVGYHHLAEKFTQKFSADWKQAHGNVSIKDLLKFPKLEPYKQNRY